MQCQQVWIIHTYVQIQGNIQIMIYTDTHAHMQKILYKARVYLKKCLKMDTSSSGTGTTTKLETFYLSLGMLTLHLKGPFVNILQDKLVIPDEAWILPTVPPEKWWQAVSPSFCYRDKELNSNSLKHMRKGKFSFTPNAIRLLCCVLNHCTTENKLLVFFFKSKNCKSEILPIPSLPTHTHTHTHTHKMIAHEISFEITVQTHFAAEFWKHMVSKNCQQLESDS